MTTDELIDGIIAREGGFSQDGSDRGGATKFGITAADLGAWRHLGRPASRAEVKALAIDEARTIYRRQYVQPFLSVPFDELRAQLVDFGVLSGTATAIRALQGVLGVPVDGLFGPRTQAALVAHDWRLVNAALVGARCRLLEGIVDRDATQLVFLHGWMRRAVSFYVA